MADKSTLRSHQTESTPADEEQEEDVFHDARFPAEEEARLVDESHAIKTEANKLFAAACYDQAVSCYDRALGACPNYLDYEVAVLRSNMAACYLKLEDWKAAVDASTASIERLDRVQKLELAAQQDETAAPSDARLVEIVCADDEEAERQQLERLRQRDARKNDVLRIRSKALLRRAKARSQLDGWANLQGAEEDYKTLAATLDSQLPPEDRKIVQRALRELPARIATARDKEMGEMMGKLKELGNGLLKPFGLSTDNFKFVQDPTTGGYSMNFQSG